MKKYYLNTLVSVGFTLLVGCQTVTPPSFFNLNQSDATLTASVNSALINNDLATVPIHVETQKGTVFLSGYVKTIRQSDTAAEVAGKVPGVRAVQNGLIVRK